MNRQWPSEMALARQTTRAIELYPSDPHGCKNCGGTEVMMLFVIESGPYRVPNGKVKWLDFPDGDGRKSGWYTGELKIEWCPICHKVN